ncbi:MAG: hypothetical protein NTX87_18740 [Planctomycetota bacterium]|nr:hypothetical protein [Planctomycetota bacterium]
MTEKPFKFGVPLHAEKADPRGRPHQYPNIWAREKAGARERLVLAPAEKHVDLVIDLLGEMPEPFGILYVLLVSRCDRKAGRYQSQDVTDRPTTERFLRDYADYFENDGRHHVWVASVGEEAGEAAQVIYDNHNIVYAYGLIERLIDVAAQWSLTEQSEVRFPVPHQHQYNREYDGDEDRLMQQHAWKYFSLQPYDDPGRPQ